MGSETIAIVTLLDKAKLELNEFVVHVEVVLNKHAESTAKRMIEKEGCVNDPCLNKQGISPPKMINIEKDKGFDVNIEIEGCLQPKTSFKPGQNKLNFQGKSLQCKRVFALKIVPSNDPTASIHFYGKNKSDFLHRVEIDVKSELVPKPGANTTESTADTDSSYSPTMSSSLTSTMASSMVPNSTCSGGSSLPASDYSAGSEADDDIITVYQRSLDIAIVQSSQILHGAIQDAPSLAGSFRELVLEENRCKQFLKEQSLIQLAKELSPQDASSLVIYLGLSSTDFQQVRADHPTSIVTAIHETLKKWRDRAEGTDEDKLKKIVYSLGAIHRNDLKAKAEASYRNSLSELNFK